MHEPKHVYITVGAGIRTNLIYKGLKGIERSHEPRWGSWRVNSVEFGRHVLMKISEIFRGLLCLTRVGIKKMYPSSPFPDWIRSNYVALGCFSYTEIFFSDFAVVEYLFKVSNNDPCTMSINVLCLYCRLWISFFYIKRVFYVNFEQVFIWNKIFLICLCV